MALDFLSPAISQNLELLGQQYSKDFFPHLLSILAYSVGLAIYVIVVWYYYKALSKRDTFTPKIKYPGELGGTFWTNLRIGFGFMFKYLVIFPFISFFWFLVLSAFLLFLSKSQDIGQTLLMSMTIVAASRITAYYHEEISENVAKIVPLGIVGVFVLDPSSFTITHVLTKFSLLPSFFYMILQYLSYVVMLEVALRIIYNIGNYILLDREMRV